MTSALTTFVFERCRILVQGPRRDRPRPLGLSLAHWRLSLDTALLRPLQRFDSKSEIAEGLRLLRLALSIDANDPEALSLLGRQTASLFGDFDIAREMVDRAVAFNPNASIAWGDRGWTYLTAGQPEEAIRSFERVIRLSPFDPWLFSAFTGMSFAFVGLDRFDEAIAAAKKALQKNQAFAPAYRSLIAALAHLGREAEARVAATALLKLKPDFRISEWHAGRSQPQMLIDGLRKAGLPE